MTSLADKFHQQAAEAALIKEAEYNKHEEREVERCVRDIKNYMEQHINYLKDPFSHVYKQSEAERNIITLHFRYDLPRPCFIDKLRKRLDEPDIRFRIIGYVNHQWPNSYFHIQSDGRFSLKVRPCEPSPPEQPTMPDIVKIMKTFDSDITTIPTITTIPITPTIPELTLELEPDFKKNEIPNTKAQNKSSDRCCSCYANCDLL